MLNPLAAADSPLLPVYAQWPLTPVSGRGCWITDASGNHWLDLYGGHAVAATGHSHPAVVRAIAEQAERLLFYSTVLPHRNREALAAAIVSRCPPPLAKIFFCNSGAEANENALHLARRATGRQKILALAGGWHGRTAATLALTDGEHYAAGAQRAGLMPAEKIPFNDLAALAQMIDGSVAALIIEPVQGVSGARACSAEFLVAARAACTRAGALLIFDEIQCGTGRTGRFTAAEAFGVTPDFITLAKGLAAGLPIGAVVTTAAASQDLKVGDLGSTFGGGPLVCAAALANLAVIDDEALLENCRSVGAQLAAGARALRLAVDGRGLLLGLRLPGPAAAIQQALFAKKILTGTAADPAVLRLMPPLSLRAAEADLFLAALAAVLP